MIVRIQRQAFDPPSDRKYRLPGIGIVALGIGVLAVWNPLTQPGPTVCLLRRAVGLPCPLCGMTRGVALCLRGYPIEASHFNPLTVPVLLLAVVLALKWAIEYGLKMRFDVTMPRSVWRAIVFVGYALLLANWAYMITVRREDPFVTSWLGQAWTAIVQ